MKTIRIDRAARTALACSLVTCAVALQGCGSDGVSTSVSVGVGYGGYYGPYYGPGYYGPGYYDPYPPVVIVPPGRPERPNYDRPTTLPAEVGPSRPPNVSRPTTRPSPRPATRPMPRAGRR